VGGGEGDEIEGAGLRGEALEAGLEAVEERGG
jgi:hypothetical protein